MEDDVQTKYEMFPDIQEEIQKFIDNVRSILFSTTKKKVIIDGKPEWIEEPAFLSGLKNQHLIKII